MKSVTFENLKKQNYTMKESLRALKTNIQFCGDDICTIVVTSAMPNEGKSTDRHRIEYIYGTTVLSKLWYAPN